MTTTHDSKRMTFSYKTDHMLTEASDLGWPVGRVPKTFDIILYAAGEPETHTAELYNTRRDNENDIICWVYVIRDIQSPVSGVTVYND